VDAILGFVAKTMGLSGGSFRMEVHDVVANDDHAVALFGARAEREGRSYENRNVLVIHIRNGKLVETWRLSQDQYAADEFFSQRGIPNLMVALIKGRQTARLVTYRRVTVLTSSGGVSPRMVSGWLKRSSSSSVSVGGEGTKVRWWMRTMPKLGYELVRLV
jgi:hypothetical protein